MRQAGGEEDRMLAGAAADLQHRAAVVEMVAEHFENRLAIFLAGRGVGLFHKAA